MTSPYAIQTYTGLMFNYSDPLPEQVCVEDIAHALSQTPRFGGHATRFYSVAEHAVLVHDLVQRLPPVSPELAYAALHHDSHEAYIGDCPTPLKVTVPALRALASRIDVAVAAALRIYVGLFHHRAVVDADRRALLAEGAAVCSPVGYWATHGRPLDGWKPGFWSPASAKDYFLDAHEAALERLA